MSVETKNIRENISLKGSTKIVVEFFGNLIYAINYF
jgi:hypothetical protein